MPWARVLSFTDPFVCQTAIQAADVEIYPTAAGAFQAEITQIGFSRLWMQRFHQHLPQIAAFAIKPGRKAISFLTKARQPALHHCGMDVGAGEIIVNDFGMVHQRSEMDFHNGSMSLTVNDFEAAARAIAGFEYPCAAPRHL